MLLWSYILEIRRTITYHGDLHNAYMHWRQNRTITKAQHCQSLYGRASWLDDLLIDPLCLRLYANLFIPMCFTELYNIDKHFPIIYVVYSSLVSCNWVLVKMSSYIHENIQYIFAKFSRNLEMRHSQFFFTPKINHLGKIVVDECKFEKIQQKSRCRHFCIDEIFYKFDSSNNSIESLWVPLQNSGLSTMNHGHWVYGKI